MEEEIKIESNLNFKVGIKITDINIDLIKSSINNIIFTDNKNMKIEINGKKYKMLKSLKGGKTNLVGLAENEEGEKIVIKKVKNKSASLQREIDFFGYISDNNIEGFPKLLDTDNGGKTIVLEFQEGENGQDIKISNENWEIIGEDFGKKLNSLHKNKVELNDIEIKKSIANMINYFDIGEENLNFFKEIFNIEKNKLKKILEENNEEFVMNHGDFSPHNCLFKKDDNGNYKISTILDPSGRAGYGSRYFDITYLLNTRHNKNKGKLKEGFIKNYNIDYNSELFKQFDKVMKMYLIELYNLMDLKEDSKKLYDENKKDLQINL